MPEWEQMTGSTETEVKLRVPDATAVFERLEGAGFGISQPREFEANTLFDTRDQKLLKAGMLLRLRQAGSRSILTWKGPAISGPHKSRPERETSVGSLDALASILTELGYNPTFRYEKFRTEFRAEGAGGAVVFDETPIGAFLELEGEAGWIDKTAQLLGFSPADYVLDSYGALYRKFCESQGLQPSHMVFSSQ
jgi:adenylate cyclase class 2